MHLRLDSASGLPSPDCQTGPANPFVVALLNGHKQQTGVKTNSRSPQWGEHFEWAALTLTLTLGLTLTLTVILTLTLTPILTLT